MQLAPTPQSPQPPLFSPLCTRPPIDSTSPVGHEAPSDRTTLLTISRDHRSVSFGHLSLSSNTATVTVPKKHQQHSQSGLEPALSPRPIPPHSPLVSATNADRPSHGTKLTADSVVFSKPFHPASLPAPRRAIPITNIWAQPLDTPTSVSSSSAASDLDLHSSLVSTQPKPVGTGAGPPSRTVFSHLTSSNPGRTLSTHSLIGSPPNLADLSSSHSLAIDRLNRASLSPTSPLSASFGPNSLPAAFYEPWNDSPLSLGDDERIGRSKARDILRPSHHDFYRDPSVGSIGSPCSSSARSGIGLSNMSPFTGTSLLPPGSGSGMSFGATLAGAHDLNRGASRARDSSLGAIGTGRMNSSRASIASTGAVGSGLGLSSASRMMLSRSGENHLGSLTSTATDNWFMGGRSLSNDLDEDDEFAPPTKSGATSRRHSVAAFTGRSMQGFESIVSRSGASGSYNNNSINGASRQDKKAHNAGRESAESALSIGIQGTGIEDFKNGRMMFGTGASMLSDEDLLFSSDLNSLNLNLEAHAQRQQNQQRHCGSFEFNHRPHLSRPLESEKQTPRFNPNLDSSSLSTGNVNTHMPWASSIQPAPAPPPLPTLQFGLPTPPNLFSSGPPARKSSFSAGDPYSSSAVASRFFASQADPPPKGLQQPHQHQQQPQQQPVGSRFPFSHPGNVVQPSTSLSTPSVTTFSAGGLLSKSSTQLRLPFTPDLSSIGSTSTPFDHYTTFHPAPISLPHPSSMIMSDLNNSSSTNTTSGLGGPNTFGSPFSTSSLPFLTSAGPGPNELSELGKGVPLHQLAQESILYIVEFKGGRTDLFYLGSEVGKVERGDFVIVEADRGKDLGKVLRNMISVEEVQKFQNQQLEHVINGGGDGGGFSSAGHATSVTKMTKEIHPKKIFGKANDHDAQQLTTKAIDESKALALCRSKALQRGLKMEIISAEWQFDRRKLTFFFTADKRIDFRDLVKDLFRTWKTRIW